MSVARRVKPIPDKAPSNSVHPKTRSEWRAWLAAHHLRAEGVWLVTYKKASGKPRMDYDEAVEEALCFGWVDSKPARLDDERSMLYFAPRKPKAGWSQRNKERVEKLIAARLMMPAGLAKVEAAKRDGSWSRLDAVETLEIPQDLEQALAAYPSARRHFEAFPRSVKRGILEWISSARKPETRAKRIAETAQLAEKNLRANQWRRYVRAAEQVVAAQALKRAAELQRGVAPLPVDALALGSESAIHEPRKDRLKRCRALGHEGNRVLVIRSRIGSPKDEADCARRPVMFVRGDER
ncbi:MAG: YdeI/OmpD-associated family protein [Burkholderiales bacterium]|nr:YdeI/OmpD-associated family protein [Burkholderiales bacterium]